MSPYSTHLNIGMKTDQIWTDMQKYEYIYLFFYGIEFGTNSIKCVKYVSDIDIH